MFLFVWYELGTSAQNTSHSNNTAEFTNLTTVLNYNKDLCTEVRQLFVMKHIGSSDLVPDQQIKGNDLEICPSPKSCCTNQMVERYIEAAKKDFRNMLQTSSSYLKTLIASSATKFRENFVEMIQLSENNTNFLFSDVYKKMDTVAREPVVRLYSDLLSYINGRKINLEERIWSFFDSLFPLVYHHSINPKLKDFSDDYKECLRQTQQEIKPFGDIARKVAEQLTRSFEAAHLFLEAMNLGVEVANSTEHLEINTECSKSLFRLTYCAHCHSLVDAKPCSGFCLNVIRGCLAGVAELDQPWNGYIIALERLTSGMVGSYNIEETLSTLDTKISEAIMYAMENGPELSKKVKATCGHPRRATREVISESVLESPKKIVAIRSTDTSLYMKIQTFVHKLTETKGYHANLADAMCNYDTMVGKSGDTCWNGNSLGEYSKTIAGIGIFAQKHNPEIKFSSAQDVVLSTLIDKLNHIKQLLNSKMTSLPQSDSYTMEGSGSGRLWGNNIGDDEDYHDGSGSGDYDDARESDFDFNGGNTDKDSRKDQERKMEHGKSRTGDVGGASSYFNLSSVTMILLIECILLKYAAPH
ncbi:glypican-5 isoform X2 [Centruroides vittatus]|uniref:glypican-5 isoform X2 n=1 Tax=Centruroides vittatus TaxID=120091 RepID=UPI0035108CFF